MISFLLLLQDEVQTFKSKTLSCSSNTGTERIKETSMTHSTSNSSVIKTVIETDTQWLTLTVMQELGINLVMEMVV